MMSKQPYRCPSVTIDGREFTALEEFCDYVPEGVVLAARPVTRKDWRCLCGLDIEATAKQNGYECVDNGGYRFTFKAKAGDF